MSEVTLSPVAVPTAGTLFRKAGFRRRLLRRPTTLFALVFLALLFALAILAPLVTAYDPLGGGDSSLLEPLSPGHWLGTDDLGRDIWARVVFGTRISLTVGVLSALCAVVVGVIVGALAGYFGGWLDALLMRIAEFFQTLPRFVVALIVIALFGTSVFKMIVVIAALAWPQLARVVRASVAALAQSQFVDAARVAGMGHGAIILREILPNVAAPIIVLGSLDIAMAILIEASLSFFGLGDPNHVSWGAMLNDAQQYLRSAWWMSAFPGLAIALTVLSFNVFGDALNDALNPRGHAK
ncbi:peptide/nickel transport system permease protein [Variovorax sp. HW608]|uniref:ABC transporter permease n=1 Tax=Variovorax sp. HW608 TaxID=1034889 RepID=UPI00081FBCC2|nr:ABC transporter permease [Variovorax sp. HW608]SCK23653.1 peptide/nickel transport system permease protein [Variovorax sp. HW608]